MINWIAIRALKEALEPRASKLANTDCRLAVRPHPLPFIP
jgi:hypothetical protein